ncbi:MAG: hypothetical protein KatS3mg115_1516 [Candidatus Poribacteria bacterium]|nr:MAG: hypothetical protein KatS3mg115_1516 [Candidatus Poribacteria bacterium]
MVPRPHLSHERYWWNTGAQHVAGVDEAGRGPLAGPVVAAAVIFPPHIALEGLEELNDSKRMSQNQRERIYRRIQELALAVSVARVEAEEIDRINILQASLKAMAQALLQLRPRPEVVLVDGTQVPTPYLPASWQVPCHPIVRGDGKSLSIAAASVVAKVTRDRIMVEYDALYPRYGFAQHKGYPSPAHREAIARWGVCPIHRKTFRGVREHLNPLPMALSATAAGRSAEALAAEYLQAKGYRVLERNFRTPEGELDLIAQEGKTLVFVEVKARRSARYGSGEESVTPAKQRRLTAAALHYLQQTRTMDRPCRFDLIVIRKSRRRTEIRHLPNAFPAADFT